MKIKSMWLTLGVALGVTLLQASISWGQACGNNNTGGAANNDSDPDNGDPVQVNTGSEFRKIQDLRMWGGVGQEQLSWTRCASSRNPGSINWFGNGHSFRYNYQWEMVSAGKNSSGALQLEIFYPDGAAYTFAQGTAVTTGPEQAGTSPTLWQPVNGSNTLAMGDLLYQNGSNLYLQRANGFVYHFTQNTNATGGIYYLMTDFFDAQNNQYLLSYNAGHQLTQVTEPGGRYLQITYATLSLNNLNSTTLAKISSVPVANQYTTLSVTNTGSYRYLRYLSPDSSYGDVAEVKFFDKKGNLLTGTPLGSGPAAATGTDYTQALDGNIGTYFDSTVPTGNFVGIDLGPGKTASVGSVQFYPRPGYEARMYSQPGFFSPTSGSFQGSNQAPATITVISSVTSSDGRTVTYNYQPFADPLLPTVFQTLASVTYEDGTQATYTSQQIEPGTRPLISAFVDPRYNSALSKSRTLYFTGTTVNFGQIHQQLSYDTQTVLQTIGIGSGGLHNPTATNGNGAVESFFMTNGLMTWWTDGLGHRTNYAYDHNGWGYRISTTDPLGHKTTVSPSILGNPLQITYPDNSTESWTRDNRDLPLTHTDQLGRITTYARDSQHRTTQVTYPDGSTEGFSYNSFSEVTSHKMRNGGTESFLYDSRGLLTSKTDAVGKIWKYTYDGSDRVASQTDPLNHTMSYLYSSRGFILTATNADSSTKTSTYSLFGDKTSDTNELGKTWTYAYDQFRRRISVTDPLNRTTQDVFPQYVTLEVPLSRILPSGKTTTYTYDLEWNLLSSTSGSGTADAATIRFAYDNDNRRVKTTDPRGNAKSFTYDLLNRLLTVTDPLNRVTKRTYDVAGNLLTVVRPDNGVTTNTYDTMNRLISSTDPKQETVTRSYDSSGNLTSLRDAKGDTYTYSYDLLNRKLSLSYPDSSSESMTYDSAGNVAQMKTREGKLKSSIYNSRNWETSYTWSDTTPSVQRTYDTLGRLVSLTNQASTVSYTYDTANQMLSETQKISGLGTSPVLNYTYDLDGNRLSLTEPDSTVTGYSYTNRNQVSAIAQSTALVQYSYDLAGNRLSRNLENGTLTTYGFDGDNELTSLTVAISGVPTIASFTYSYDSASRRTSVGREDGTKDTYSYDSVDQIAGVQYGTSSSNTKGTRSVGYVWDAVGNRASVTDTSTTTSNYSVNNLNEYLTTSGGAVPATYGYSGNGNLTSGNGTYVYDSQNRLLSAAVGTQTETFAYDAENRCVKRTLNGIPTYLVYDGWNLIEERDASNKELNRYAHGVATDELIYKVNSSDYVIYYNQDGLGSTARLTDSTGKVLEKYAYDVYGKVAISNATGQALTASAYANRFLFTGREFLAEVGLYDYRNRVYSADLGRFLQTDPLRFDAGDINIYRYCGNNVLLRTDAMGLCDTMDEGSGDGSFDDDNPAGLSNPDLFNNIPASAEGGGTIPTGEGSAPRG